MHETLNMENRMVAKYLQTLALLLALGLNLKCCILCLPRNAARVR